jgi:hypothetical protein
MTAGVPKTRRLQGSISYVMHICCAICNMSLMRSDPSGPISLNGYYGKVNEGDEQIWKAGVSPERREAVIQYYKDALDAIPSHAFDSSRGAHEAFASDQA